MGCTCSAPTTSVHTTNAAAGKVRKQFTASPIQRTLTATTALAQTLTVTTALAPALLKAGEALSALQAQSAPTASSAIQSKAECTVRVFGRT